VIPNKAAQDEGFMIPTNMGVPAASVIHRLFLDETAGDGSGRVIAIVQPVEPVRQKNRGQKEKGLYED
jgi:hypothetical protein